MKKILLVVALATWALTGFALAGPTPPTQWNITLELVTTCCSGSSVSSTATGMLTLSGLSDQGGDQWTATLASFMISLSSIDGIPPVSPATTVTNFRFSWDGFVFAPVNINFDTADFVCSICQNGQGFLRFGNASWDLIDQQGEIANSFPEPGEYSGTYSVTPKGVPEPSSLLLALVGLGGLSAWRRSKR